jgi:hypothetical protein
MMNCNQQKLSTPKRTTNNAPKIVLALGPYQERSDAVVREWIHNVVPKHMRSQAVDSWYKDYRVVESASPRPGLGSRRCY